MTTQGKLLARLAEPAVELDFEALYKTELPRIYNFFRYRTGSDELAEDLTAATFEKAWRNRDRYRRDLAAFSTWLYTIARRVAIDHARRRRPEVPLAAANAITSSDNPEDAAQQHADFERLAVLLARLADRDRELVALKYGAGLTNRTIAGLTGLSESNVGVILHRAVQSLRAQWDVEP